MNTEWFHSLAIEINNEFMLGLTDAELIKLAHKIERRARAGLKAQP